MAATLLEGEELASQIKADIKKDIEALKAKGVTPHLVALQVGENAAAAVYTKMQKKSCEEVGIEYELRQLPDGTSQDDTLKAIDGINADKKVTGIILMMPLPSNINARALQIRIAPEKDVEGMNPANLGRLFYGEMGLAPCTAKAAVELLKSTGMVLKGKEIVVVGHSEIVGKPVAMMLLASQNESPTPTVCHIATKDLAFHTKRADIIFVACGVPGLIKANMVSDGVTVIDIGINRVPLLDENGKPVLDDKGKAKKKIVGDCDFEGIKGKARFITPVPGGVGVVTTTILLKNTVEAAKIAAKKV